MIQRTRRFEVNGEAFEVAWNMHAWDTFKRITGKEIEDADITDRRHIIAIMYAAVDAAAALRDHDAPITERRFNALFATAEDFARAGEALAELLPEANPETQPETAGKKAVARKSVSRSRAATRSAQSISESPSASSGG